MSEAVVDPESERDRETDKGTAPVDSRMADRSDEATKSADSRSTEELLEETDEILSGSTGTGAETPADAGRSGTDVADEGFGTSGNLDSSEAHAGESDAELESSSSGWLPSWPSSLVPWRSGSDDSRASGASRASLSRALSPRSLLAVALLIGAGLLVGGTVVPVAGRIAGTLAVTFLLGALTSRRRYLEVAVAAVAVGALGGVFDNVVLTVGGSARTVVAVGAGTAVATAIVGYYFGRDLRNGLSRDVENVK